MKNVQISFDEDLLERVDELAASSHQARSAVVREALESWLRRREIREFEEKWIASLKEHPQDIGEVEAWAKAETWSDE